ncbi:MAG: flippase [Candidatus Cloacimonetes bacterium]|nr:flippase [Candidatus Cloacimonadota bacterium]
MKAYLTIASNTLFQLLSRAATAIIALIVTRLITQNLGLQGYGDYQIVLSFVTLFWILTDFGLNAVVVREMASNEERLQSLFSALFSLRTALGVFLVFLCLAILSFLPYQPAVKLGVIVASLTIFAQGLMGASHGIFQVKLRYERLFISNLIGSLLLLALMLWATSAKLGVVALSFAFTTGYLVMTIASLLFIRTWVKLKFSFDKALLKHLFIKTLPFGTALLFSLATFKIDAILLSVLPLAAISNNEAVGIYNLSCKVFELALVVPTFFMNVMYPILIRHFEESLTKFKSTFLKTLGSLSFAGIAAAILIYFLAPFIVQALAKGEGFTPSINVLRILILASPVFYLSSLFMWVVLVFKKQKALIFIYLISFIFNFLTNYHFIPKYTYTAAAIITGATEALTLLILISASIYFWRQHLAETSVLR